MEFSEYQQNIFDFIENNKGNAIVEAVAGSGKTTTIVEATKYMDGEVVVTAFNKSMADELQLKTVNMPNVKAATFHSLGYGALAKLGKVRLNTSKIYNIVQKMAEKTPSIKAFTSFIIQTVGIAKQQGVGVGDNNIKESKQWLNIVDHYNTDDSLQEVTGKDMDIIISTGIDYCIYALNESNKETNLIDFDDMVYLPLYLGLNIRKYDWILVDEAQDTNITRHMFIKKMMGPNSRLIAVGDPRQAIFGFTGANSDSLEIIAKDFNAKTLPLSITYRCPKTVVSEARKIVDHIECADTAPDGAVINVDYSEITKKDGDLAVFGRNSAVLCRYNKQLVTLFFSLVRNGIGCQILGRNFGKGLVGLCKKWVTNDLTQLTDKLEEYRDREVARAITKDRMGKVGEINDRIDTLIHLIDQAQAQDMNKNGLIAMINDMFSDTTVKGLLTLSSVHKAKGLEWDNVYILGRHTLMPSKWAKQAWQKDQEDNLIYVAVTRAQNNLVYVNY